MPVNACCCSPCVDTGLVSEDASTTYTVTITAPVTVNGSAPASCSGGSSSQVVTKQPTTLWRYDQPIGFCYAGYSCTNVVVRTDVISGCYYYVLTVAFSGKTGVWLKKRTSSADTPAGTYVADSTAIYNSGLFGPTVAANAVVS